MLGSKSKTKEGPWLSENLIHMIPSIVALLEFTLIKNGLAMPNTQLSFSKKGISKVPWLSEKWEIHILS